MDDLHPSFSPTIMNTKFLSILRDRINSRINIKENGDRVPKFLGEDWIDINKLLVNYNIASGSAKVKSECDWKSF